MNEEDKLNIYLDGEETTLAEIDEKKQNLKNSERIVETNPGTFHLIERIQG